MDAGQLFTLIPVPASCSCWVISFLFFLSFSFQLSEVLDHGLEMA